MATRGRRKVTKRRSNSPTVRVKGEGCPCRRRMPWHLIELVIADLRFEHHCTCGRIWVRKDATTVVLARVDPVTPARVLNR